MTDLANTGIPVSNMGLYSTGFMSPLEALGAAMMANSGPSRLPIPLGTVVGRGMLAGANAYQAGALHQQQIDALRSANALKALQVAGYKRIQAALNGGAPTKAAAAYGGIPATATDIPLSAGASNAVLNSNGASGASMTLPAFNLDNPLSAGPLSDPVSRALGTPTRGGAPLSASPMATPVSNPVRTMELGRMFLGIPGSSATGAALMSLANKRVPEGAALTSNGGIAPMPGYLPFVQAHEQAYAGGRAAGNLPYAAPRAAAQERGRESVTGPHTRTIYRHSIAVQQEWNPATQTWKDVGSGPRFGFNFGASKEATNAEIREARKTLSQIGMSASELRTATQPLLANGMPNPNYHAGLSRVISLATKHLKGVSDPDLAATWDRVYGTHTAATPTAPSPARAAASAAAALPAPHLPAGASVPYAPGPPITPPVFSGPHGKPQIDASKLQLNRTYMLGGKPYRWDGKQFVAP